LASKRGGSVRGAYADVSFTRKDFDVLDLTLSTIPELRICAYAVKRARSLKVRYPIETVETVVAGLEHSVFEGAGHRITPADIRNYMPKEFFPIRTERELLSKIFVALNRCKYEMGIVAQLSPQMRKQLATPTQADRARR